MINFFLNQNEDLKIEIFSIYHFLLILTVFLLIGLIILNKNKFKNLSLKKQKKIRYILGSLLVVNIVLRRGSLFYYNVYDWRINLDIGFCNFTSLMFLLYCLSGKKQIYSICYYMAFAGPLISVLIPSINMTPLNYSFYSFLITHHIVFIFNFIFLYMEEFKFKMSDFKKAILFIFIYTFGIYIFNIIFNVNYNYPLAFVNNEIEQTLIIKILSYNDFTLYLTFYFVVVSLSFVGKFVLKFLNSKT